MQNDVQSLLRQPLTFVNLLGPPTDESQEIYADAWLSRARAHTKLAHFDLALGDLQSIRSMAEETFGAGSQQIEASKVFAKLFGEMAAVLSCAGNLFLFLDADTVSFSF